MKFGFALGAGLAVGALVAFAFWRKKGSQGAIGPGETRGTDTAERADPRPFFARIMSETSNPPQSWDVEVTNNDPAALEPIDFKLLLKVHNVSPFGTGNGDGVPFHVRVPPLSSSIVRVESGVAGSPLFLPALWRAEVFLDTVLGTNDPSSDHFKLDSVVRIGV